MMWLKPIQLLICSLAVLNCFLLPPAALYMSTDLHDAFSFFDKLQNPTTCEGREYAVIEMGCGGGFAAHFQLAASEWLRVASFFNYTVPVLIKGHIRGYSDGPECARVDKDWTCFFLPMSSCQDKLVAAGKRINAGYKSINDPHLIPSQFAHKGLAWWWGAIQARMFRLQPAVQAYIMHESSLMDNGKGFPFSLPVAGVHVRHGDKASDGFKMQSLDAEMAAIRKSPECIIDGKSKVRHMFTGVCEDPASISVSVSANSSAITASPDSSSSSSSSSAVSHTVHAPVGMIGVGSGADFLHSHLRIFVASDDPAVLLAAKSLGHLVDSSGISQSTASAGMFSTLISHPEMGYNASLEIIADIFFLSRCSTLVGIAASQVYRMAVGISNSTGVLKYAVAMDYAALPKIRKMSMKYDIPLPEEFSLP